MAEKTFNQTFQGYWRDENNGGIPNQSGVYCVYECTHNKSESKVTLHKLIYIGESGDVGHRIQTHNRRHDWLRHVRPGNELCFNFTPVEESYRIRLEAAYINRHTPPENTEYTNYFPFDKTIVNTDQSKGQAAHIDGYFVVNRR